MYRWWWVWSLRLAPCCTGTRGSPTTRRTPGCPTWAVLSSTGTSGLPTSGSMPKNRWTGEEANWKSISILQTNNFKKSNIWTYMQNILDNLSSYQCTFYIVPQEQRYLERKGPGIWPAALEKLQRTRAGNLLIRSSLIRSFCSNQMSDCERFAQIAQDKWATVSESLRSLKTNERPWANRSGRSWQMSHRERFAQVAHDK